LPNTIVPNYLSNFEYKDNQFDFAMTPAGRITYTGQQYQYEYDYTDHLGNVRLTFSDLNGDGSVGLVNPLNEILQEQHYYPFGMNLGGLDYVQGVANAYQFNGKEKQTGHGLNWYDYGARMYDPVIGRWGGVDVLGDVEHSISMTPFNFVADNPILNIDPFGRDWYKNNEGTVVYDENIKSQDDLKSVGINGTYLHADKYNKSVLDAIGADIMTSEDGYGAFIFYYENNPVLNVFKKR
jgi:RHS repeat-associated protein